MPPAADHGSEVRASGIAHYPGGAVLSHGSVLPGLGDSAGEPSIAHRHVIPIAIFQRRSTRTANRRKLMNGRSVVFREEVPSRDPTGPRTQDCGHAQEDAEDTLY